MSDDVYVCSRLNRFGTICYEYVLMPEPDPFLTTLAITRDEMVMISSSLGVIFSIMLAFAMIAKAVKVM